MSRNLIVKESNRYFLLNKDLKGLVTHGFFCAGIYLGKARGKTFFPSFSLLAMIACADANKTTVDRKAEWLFICGRDIFRQGVTSETKSAKKGSYTLVLNERGDCLGFGRRLHSINEGDGEQVYIKNIADIGDFLRREK